MAKRRREAFVVESGHPLTPGIREHETVSLSLTGPTLTAYHRTADDGSLESSNVYGDDGVLLRSWKKGEGWTKT